MRGERQLQGVDINMSYIKWAGIRKLHEIFRSLEERCVPVRIVTTTLMGISEPEAIHELASFKNITIKVLWAKDNPPSFHAKSWRFHGDIKEDYASGHASLITGSSNMTASGLLSGMEHNDRVIPAPGSDQCQRLRDFEETFEKYWRSDDPESFKAYYDEDPITRPKLYKEEHVIALRAEFVRQAATKSQARKRAKARQILRARGSFQARDRVRVKQRA